MVRDAHERGGKAVGAARERPLSRTSTSIIVDPNPRINRIGGPLTIGAPGDFPHADRKRRSRYFKPVTKKQAEAITPKIKGANRGNAAMGKMARKVNAAWR
jgi:hypothetical protein